MYWRDFAIQPPPRNTPILVWGHLWPEEKDGPIACQYDADSSRWQAADGRQVIFQHWLPMLPAPPSAWEIGQKSPFADIIPPPPSLPEAPVTQPPAVSLTTHDVLHAMRRVGITARRVAHGGDAQRGCLAFVPSDYPNPPGKIGIFPYYRAIAALIAAFDTLEACQAMAQLFEHSRILYEKSALENGTAICFDALPFSAEEEAAWDVALEAPQGQ